MDHKEVKELLKKYLAGECSPIEKQHIENWYADQLLKRNAGTFDYDRKNIKDDIWKDIVKNRSVNRQKNRWLSPAIAAAAVVLVGLFLHLFLKPPISEQQSIVSQTQTVPVIPGGNKAILTTADGKQYILTDLADGIVEQGEDFVITKQENGVIAFDATGQSKTSSYNTIETPKGGLYQVTLPDGSRAWLNSASSISFPSNFEDNQRIVSIKGEVYFEVVRDVRRPFKVTTPRQEIEVLGTSFNINAYEEEPLSRTTLVQGSVKVTGQSNTQILKPGYEMVSRENGKDKVALADMSSVLAWREGVFHFERIGLDVLMRQLARWYDVELVYVGELPKDEFAGRIKRNEHINKVLEVLQDGNIDVVLEGRKLIVGQNKKINQ